jgi:hypothetical protein
MVPVPSAATRREEDRKSLNTLESGTSPAAVYSGCEGLRERGGRRWRLAVLLLAVAGAGLVLVATARYGAGLSPDSLAYLDVARSLVSGKGFVYHTGEPLVWWPPLYPALLAFIGFATRLDPSAFAHLVNALLFALVIYLSAHLLRSCARRSAVFGLLGVCAVIFSRPLAEVYAMAWSGCLFVPLVLLYLIVAQRYRKGADLLSLAAMTLGTALACLTRYIGVALVPAGAATIILASGVNFKARVGRALAFAGLSLLPVGLWLVRNYRLTGTFFEAGATSRSPFLPQLLLSFETIVSWYSPLRMSWFVVIPWLAILAIAVMSSKAATRRAVRSLRSVLAAHLPFVLMAGVYVLSVSAVTTAYSAIGDRLLAPTYVPITLILLNLGLYLLTPTEPTAGVATSKVPLVLLALWLCLPLQNVVSATAGRFKDGAGGYNTKACRESETVACARQVLSTTGGVRVYSNGPDVLWELAGANATEAPRRTKVSLGYLKGRWPAENGSVLVWFANLAWRRYLFTIEELQKVATLREVAHLSDGSVFWLSVRRTTAPDSAP